MVWKAGQWIAVGTSTWFVRFSLGHNPETRTPGRIKAIGGLFHEVQAKGNHVALDSLAG